MNSKSNLLEFYSKPGVMTDFGEHSALIDGLPRDIASLATVLQGLLIHEHIAPAYGVELSDERRSEVHARSVRELLSLMLSHDSRPLDVPRELERRIVGNCRDYSMLLTAILRLRGIPARARCGFATYFDANSYVDHWVCEYWRAEESRWVMADAQLDAVQRDLFHTDFDVLDVPPDRFLVAGEAWRRSRAGEDDPEKFGIMDMRGYWFIAGDVVRDIAALNKVEMLPWDCWEPMLNPGEEPDARQFRQYEELAELSLHPDANFERLREVFETGGLRVPPAVFNSIRNGQEEWQVA